MCLAKVGRSSVLAIVCVAPLLGQITVEWNDNSTNETSFKIERAVGDGNFQQVGSVAANVTAYTDNDVTPFTRYSYRVRASNARGDSSYTGVVVVTAPGAQNTAPRISGFEDITLSTRQSRGVLAFTVSDGESEATDLIVSAVSSNTVLLPDSGILFGGGGANRSITMIPADNQSGNAIITVTVSDGIASTTASFVATVEAMDAAPGISKISDQAAATGSSTGPIGFAITGVDTSLDGWSLSGSSSNTALVPNANISFAGTGMDRTVTVVPSPGQNGSTTIMISISKGTARAISSFTLNVGPISIQTFVNPAGILIPDAGRALPVTSAINVSELRGRIIDVAVTLHDVNHSWIGDVDLVLVSPDREKVLFLSDAGAGPVAGATLEFTDTGRLAMPESGPVVSGTYSPTNHDPFTDNFPDPAPSGPYSNALSAFNGHSPTGQWILYAQDDSPGNEGSITGGWSLTISTVPNGPSSPTMTEIPSQTLAVNASTEVLSFVISDADTPEANLVVGSSSSNPALVPASRIVFGGSGANRTVKVTPAMDQTGTSTIAVTVSDGTLTAVRTFVVTVNAVGSSAPELPTITSPARASGAAGRRFMYNITATNAPTHFDAMNLPPGLQVNAMTGAITGAPEAIGSFEVLLSASNASGADVAPLMVQVNAPASDADQIVSIEPLGGSLFVGQPVTLRASASSGLPVIFSVVRGNAVVIGNTLTVYDTHDVTVRATQTGAPGFKPASAERGLPHASFATGTLIYLGTSGADPVAAVFDVQYSRGTLYMKTSPTEALVAPLAVEVDGTINSVVTGATLGAGDGAGAVRTVRGRVANGVLNGVVVEPGRTFSATLQPSTGVMKALAGVYTANSILSESGTTYVVVSAGGESYALSMTPTLLTAGVGTLSPNGDFAIETPQAATITGSLTPAKRLTGAIRLSGQNGGTDVLGVGDMVPRTTRLTNLSSRMRVVEGSGTRALIAGIVVSGTEQKRMLLRGLGPSLARIGLEGGLRNPRLQLFDNGGRMAAENDNWGNSFGLTLLGDRVGAFRLVPDSLDAALVAALFPGVYTLQVASAGGDGVALAEVYDVSEDSQSTSLINLSTRGYIDGADGAIISGFAIGGNVPMRVLVRGIGPALERFGVTGVITDPILQLYQGSALIAQNDNWGTPQPVTAVQSAASPADVAAAVAQVGAFPMPSGSRDAAIIIMLAPGTYTAVVSGASNTAGSGLLEIYQARGK